MAKNTGKGYRKGPIKNRTQTRTKNGNAIERDTKTGKFINQKTTPGDFKDVRHEK